MASKFKPFHRKAFDQYGSSMGRDGSPPREFENATRGRCERVPLDRLGYDRGGAYWGVSKFSGPLWCVRADSADGEEALTSYVRAPDRAAAKAKFPRSVKWLR